MSVGGFYEALHPLLAGCPQAQMNDAPVALHALAQNQAVPHQPVEQGRGGGSNHAKMLPDNAGRAAGMVGDEEQCLDVDRVEFEGALDGGAASAILKRRTRLSIPTRSVSICVFVGFVIRR